MQSIATRALGIRATLVQAFTHPVSLPATLDGPSQHAATHHILLAAQVRAQDSHCLTTRQTGAEVQRMSAVRDCV